MSLADYWQARPPSEPALKDGNTIPVLVDLIVQFRIFSKRTASVASQRRQINSRLFPRCPAATPSSTVNGYIPQRRESL